ncbi:hypothetical protein F4808DRAFT_473377 [Astrocystis sublimbata]|nr:hypothetical protein F4808DRAFT_473377 [Astrocystis sublimbata]
MSEETPTERLIKAGFEPKDIALPSDVAFVERQSSYFSCNARTLRPAGIIQPKSAQEVSSAIRSLVAANIPFAVRSSGHTSWPGSNNIGPEGVTIDLGRMEWVEVLPSEREEQKEVSLGPGCRWGNVYSSLAERGLAVAGGREAYVGVAGLILGGGMTFYGGRYGLACDNLCEVEIVLADGQIVHARQEGEHADLFRALKGGSNNFGIVTNFKMRAFPLHPVWSGFLFHTKETIPEAIAALESFTNEVPNDVDSNLIFFITYLVPEAHAYKKWLQLPTISSSCKMTTIPQQVAELEQPPDYYNTWFTSTFKNDARIVAKAAELHQAVVDKLTMLVPDGDFITQCVFQPLPRIFGQMSTQSGGNVIGIDRQPHNGLLWLAIVRVRTPELDKHAYSLVREWVRAVREFAASAANIEGGDGNLPWIYLNYADKTQDPLSSYGWENVKRMKEAAAKYDPREVFQTLCPGGFKLSTVGLPN